MFIRVMFLALVIGTLGCSTENRIEDTLNLSCPTGEPSKSNIEITANQRFRKLGEKQGCTVDSSSIKVKSIGKPNAAKKCSVVVTAKCD